MPMNNISLCFRSTKSPPLPLFCWVFVGGCFFSFPGRIHILLWLFFSKFNCQREKANSKQKLSFWTDTSLISSLHLHCACPEGLPVPLPPASPRGTGQSLPANSGSQLLGTDLAVGKRFPSSASFRSDQCNAAAKSSGIDFFYYFFFPPGDLK